MRISSYRFNKRTTFRKYGTARTLLGMGLALSSLAAHSQAAPANAHPHAGLLRYPGVSAKQIVFVYANKLWVVGRAGGSARHAARQRPPA